MFRTILQIACAIFVSTSAFVAVGDSYQIRDGNVLQIMQSGNPGTSTKYQVNATMRIEGQGWVVEGNEGALGDEPIIVPPVSGGSGVKTNQVVRACDLSDDSCENIIARGPSFDTCLQGSGQSGIECAYEWARAEGLLPFPDYLALKEGGDQNQLIQDPSASGDFKAAPDKPLEKPQNPVFKPTDLITSVITPPVVAEKPTELVERPSVIINRPEPISQAVVLEPTGKLYFDLDAKSGEVRFPSNFRSAAPTVTKIDLTSPEREYFACFKSPTYLASNDLWEWLAYRLFIVLISLVCIIFLLSFWVFILWYRLTREARKERTKKSNV